MVDRRKPGESDVTVRTAVFILCAAGGLGAIVQCGGSSSPTTNPTPVPTVAPTPTPTPTPAGIVLPPGMVCDPTPPPLYGMRVKKHDGTADRAVLDSKPLVENVDHYCERVSDVSGKFCDTRLEGNPQRVACDYMAVGKALDTGRWGPTWYYNGQPCDGANAANCLNHSTEQFLAIAKNPGRFEACASPLAPVAADGSACGKCDFAAGECPGQ
jgi:hypothetical protein